MAVELIELVVRAAWAGEVVAGFGRGIEQTVDGEAVECVGDGLALADDGPDRQRRGVIVVIVGAPAVAAELVELANGEAVDAAIVERVEDRNSVGRKRNGAAHERVLARDRLVGELGLQRNLPRIRTLVLLRKRNLLLPRGDADHHGGLERLVRKAIALDIEPTLIGARLHKRREGVEDRGLRRLRGVGRLRGGVRLRLIDDRLVDRADRGDALLGFVAVGGGEIGERDGGDVARRGCDRDLARAREHKRAVDDFAGARVGPRAI